MQHPNQDKDLIFMAKPVYEMDEEQDANSSRALLVMEKGRGVKSDDLTAEKKYASDDFDFIRSIITNLADSMIDHRPEEVPSQVATFAMTLTKP